MVIHTSCGERKKGVVSDLDTLSSSSWIKLSVELRTLPNGKGNSRFPHLHIHQYHLIQKFQGESSPCKKDTHFLKFLKVAVSSNSPLMSRGYGSPFTMVNGFISINEKSKSAKRSRFLVNVTCQES